MRTPDVFVTNFNANFTGVSATIAGVLTAQLQTDLNCALVGQSLPNLPQPLTRKQTKLLSKVRPSGRSFSIWHVRRNPEMRFAIWARDVLRLPIRVVFTSAAQRLHSAYPRWLISKMDAVIATTDEAAKYIPKVAAVVPHGVDTARFSPVKDRAAVWAGLGFGGKIGLAAIGRIRPEKGTDIFVNSMISVLPKHPDAVALVVGRAGRKDETFLAGLKADVMAAGLADRILFVGEKPADQMPKLLQGISLMVPLPRYEGYGLTPLEGMSSGVPFVASDTGYFRRFLADGNYGSIVEVGDVAGATSAVDRWLGDPAALAAAGDQARKAAVAQFSIEQEASGIRKVYEAMWAGDL